MSSAVSMIAWLLFDLHSGPKISMNFSIYIYPSSYLSFSDSIYETVLKVSLGGLIAASLTITVLTIIKSYRNTIRQIRHVRSFIKSLNDLFLCSVLEIIQTFK